MPVIAWGPVAAERRIPGGAVFQAIVLGQGTVRIPSADLPRNLEIIAEGPTPGSRGHVVTSRVEDNTLVLDIGPNDSGRWLWGRRLVVVGSRGCAGRFRISIPACNQQPTTDY